MEKIRICLDDSEESNLARKLVSECDDLNFEISGLYVGPGLPGAVYRNDSYTGLDGIMFLLNTLSKKYRKAYRKVFKIKKLKG